MYIFIYEVLSNKMPVQTPSTRVRTFAISDYFELMKKLPEISREG